MCGVRGDTELATVASGSLTQGLLAGQQVGYFGWGEGDELRSRLSAVPDLDEQIGRGAVLVTSLDEHFRRDMVPDPGARLVFWSEAVKRALDGGFSGLRVVTDTTPWLDLSEQRGALLRSEHLIDRYTLEQPLTMLCVCDRSALNPDALAEISSIHAVSEGVSFPFRVHAIAGADVALAGELDAFTAPVFEQVLTNVCRGEDGGTLLIDAHALAFVEHRSLLTLERQAERLGLTALVLRDTPTTAAQLATLLNLKRVRVEAGR